MFPLLYELNTRCWLAELSSREERPVTLADVPQSEFESFESRRFTHIWLMGVWQLGERGKAWSNRCYAGRESELGCAEIAGSPYAITGYHVARALGGDAGLAAFRERLNKRGIALVLDFIPNHVALDHPWVHEHPEFFIRSEVPRAGFSKPFRGAREWYAHGDCGHGNPWVDTLQLDYGNPALQEAMLNELLTVSSRCDGVRCDMAMLVLGDVFAKTWKRRLNRPIAEFWPKAIAAARERSRDFLFLAEVYWDLEQRLLEVGFDFAYDKRLYDRLIAHDAAGAAAYIYSCPEEFTARSAHFLENHDEPRIAGLLGEAEHRAAALLILSLPGMRFLHEGQLSGWTRYANVHFSRRSNESVSGLIEQWYDALLAQVPATAVGRGRPELVVPQQAWDGNPSHANFVLVKWEAVAGVFDLAVINLAPHRGQCYAPLRIPGIQNTGWNARDLLGNEVHYREGWDLARRGFYLDVPAHAAQLFHFTACA